MGKGWLFGSDPSMRRKGSVRPIARAQDMAQQWPLVNPARLRHSIALATVSATQDSFGQPVNTWTAYLDTYAEIRQLSGQELFQGEEFTSAAQIRITLRYPNQSPVNVGDRVFFVDPQTNITHVYVIQTANDLFKRNILLELTCLEIDGSS